jgi:hypothetical protein
MGSQQQKVTWQKVSKVLTEIFAGGEKYLQKYSLMSLKKLTKKDFNGATFHKLFD